MPDVFMVAARRTPIGSFLGSLSTVPAPKLGATAIQAALETGGVPRERFADVDQVIMGNVLQAGLGQAPARQATIYSGLPDTVGAVTLHKVCGSGMRAVMDAANAIRAEEWRLVVAGGMESMSNAPHLLEGSRQGQRMGPLTTADHMIKDGLWDPYGDQHMGNCAEACVRKYGFTREDQDAYARTSYERARRATENGAFTTELTTVSVPQRKGDPLRIERDEEPFKAELSKMAQLRPAFETTGTITAANASKINDGAAALLIADARYVKGLADPLARVVAQASVAQAPEWFTTAPIGASRLALKRAGLSVRDIDLWEINEAFAAVTMAAIRELEIDPAIVNVHGGAVALGHPIGCSGARILVTLAHALAAQRKRYGVAAICIGGGEACAMVIENLRR